MARQDNVAVAEKEAGRNLAPVEGGNTIFSAWDKFYWLFGARADKIEVTSDGVFLSGLILDPAYNLDRIIEDTAHAQHRIDLIPGHFHAMGQVPEHPTSAEVSIFAAMWFGKKGEGTPDYVKQASNEYRIRFDMPLRGKGRPKGIKLNPFEPSKADADVLKDVPYETLVEFDAAIQQVIASRGVQLSV